MRRRNSTNSKDWAHRLRRYIENRPLIILVGLVVLFASQFLTIGEGFSKVRSFYLRKIAWRQVEERKLNLISAGMNVNLVKDLFGTPVLVKNSPVDLQENIFRGRGYWIQTVSDLDGSVVLYTITVCDRSFRPKLNLPSLEKSVVIGKTTFNDIEADLTAIDIFDYFISGATAPSYLFEQAYYGNPGNYQTTIWGLNDVCKIHDLIKLDDPFMLNDCSVDMTCRGSYRNKVLDRSDLQKEAKEEISPDWYYFLNKLECNSQNYSCNGVQLQAFDYFRRSTPINLVGVTSPFADLVKIRKYFNFGPNRIDTRVLGDEFNVRSF